MAFSSTSAAVGRFVSFSKKYLWPKNCPTKSCLVFWMAPAMASSKTAVDPTGLRILRHGATSHLSEFYIVQKHWMLWSQNGNTLGIPNRTLRQAFDFCGFAKSVLIISLSLAKKYLLLAYGADIFESSCNDIALTGCTTQAVSATLFYSRCIWTDYGVTKAPSLPRVCVQTVTVFSQGYFAASCSLMSTPKPGLSLA